MASMETDDAAPLMGARLFELPELGQKTVQVSMLELEEGDAGSGREWDDDVGSGDEGEMGTSPVPGTGQE